LGPRRRRARVAAGGLQVLEVPTSMTSRERTSRPGQGKSDPIDAVAIARITAREPNLTAARSLSANLTKRTQNTCSPS